MTTAYPLYDPRMEHESCGVGAVVSLAVNIVTALVMLVAERSRK
mgnify:CR=1 FL=1